MNQIIVNSFDGTPLSVKVWDSVISPVGIVQISHGICEHGGVYNEFAELLCSNGYIVFCSDHRCFGLTETSDNLGYHDGDIFGDTVSDTLFLNRYFAEKYSLPTFLFGHGYGSFIAQAVLIKNEPLKGVILSGTSYAGNLIPKIDLLFSKTLPKKKKSEFVLKSTKKSLDAYFKKEKGEYLWLTADENMRNDFLNDPLCSVVPSGNFYCSFFKGVLNLTEKNIKKSAGQDTPVAILSGRQDPVGGKLSKNAIRLYKVLKKSGYKTVRLFIYEKARNEILHEVDKYVYMEHCVTFINRCFGINIE